VDALEKCVAALKPDGTWDNPHVGIEQVRTTFEDVIRACVTDGDVKSATRAATLYDRVAAPGRGTELKAETVLGMAYTAAKKPDPANKAGELAKAAAAEYDALATAATVPAAKADALRKAAAALALAGDKAAAKERFEQILATTGLSPDAANAVRMDLADATTDPAKAAAIFQQVVEAGGTQAYGARVKLAVAQLDRAKQAVKDYGAEGKARADGWTDAAVTLLEQATTATTVSPNDQSAHEQALFTLGRVKMEKGQFADASGRLRTLLQQYPAAKESDRAKLFLASCLLVEGTSGAGNEARVKEAIDLLDPLTKSSDPFLRTQAGVRTARARLAAKQWQEAITAAQATADDSRGTVEELIALSLAYNGLAEQKRSEQCKVIESRMRRVYTDLPDALFLGTGPEYTKAYWKTNWFDWLDARK
jgi:tetratricopeptide (TPR) repeat protein